MIFLFASHLQIFTKSEKHKEIVKYELYKQCL